MKFAHLADCHLGGWREPRMRQASSIAFKIAVEKILQEKVDFVLISGDLFNTAVPSIDSLRLGISQIKRLKDSGLPIYYIAGSHDFSPSGKTMLDILEEVGLSVNVAKGEETENGKLKLKFTTDKKTGAKITGLIGKKGGLETNYYRLLDKENLEKENGHKIFLFHTALTELKPKDLQEMDAMATSLLPSGFDYYAGGHVHIVKRANVGRHKNIVYPGPTYPNNFAEIEKLGGGSLVIVEDGKIRHEKIEPHQTISLSFDADNKTPAQVTEEVLKQVEDEEINNRIITLRVKGVLESGKPADIDWEKIFSTLNFNGAYFVMKNTNALRSKELITVAISDKNVEELETQLIQEHSGQINLTEDDMQIVKKLMTVLEREKAEGEKNADYEQRIQSEIDSVMASNAASYEGKGSNP